MLHFSGEYISVTIHLYKHLDRLMIDTKDLWSLSSYVGSTAFQLGSNDSLLK